MDEYDYIALNVQLSMIFISATDHSYLQKRSQKPNPTRKCDKCCPVSELLVN